MRHFKTTVTFYEGENEDTEDQLEKLTGNTESNEEDEKQPEWAKRMEGKIDSIHKLARKQWQSAPESPSSSSYSSSNKLDEEQEECIEKIRRQFKSHGRTLCRPREKNISSKMNRKRRN